MPRASYKRFFRRFLDAGGPRLHFAAHSHHLWPDVSFDAQAQAWLDAAAHVDQKWDVIFGKLWPRAQAHVARVLDLPDAATVAFAPSTHELVVRLLSSLDAPKPRVLTTDSEFHSFSRQARRLEESGDLEVTRVPVREPQTFVARFAEAASSQPFDLIFLSHVFFDSGHVTEPLERIVSSVRDDKTVVVVDGYHAFMALPTSLRELAPRIFYVAGGYKYAMSGEGVCFLHAPPGYAERPRNTGWFAAFGALASAGGGVDYAPGGGRFLGATFDPTALYRFVAVMDWLEREGLSVEVIDAHVRHLEERFIEALDAAALPISSRDLTSSLDHKQRAHFLSFETPRARAHYDKLLAAGVVTDVRGDRLRIGFGLYHDDEDVLALIERMRACG